MKSKRISVRFLTWLMAVVLLCSSVLAGCGREQDAAGSVMQSKEQTENSRTQVNESEESTEESGEESADAEDTSEADVSEETEESTEPFVPENADMVQLQDGEYLLELDTRQSVFGQGVGDDNADGSVTFSGGSINKCMIPLPSSVKSGSTIKVTLDASFDSKADSAIRIYLTNQTFDNVTEELYIYPYTDDKSAVSFELKAVGEATGLMLASSSYDTFFQGFTLSSVIIGGDMEVTEVPSAGGAQQAENEQWYQDMLEKSQLSLGNNYRLKNILEKAQNGEKITVAAIGGSITEGSGATRYKECYAYKTFEHIKETYGAGDGSNIAFVNAGVGGTPSTFGIMRYERDIVDRTKDDDGLPDIVMVEYAVNDGGEPTYHGCYESLVKHILQQDNAPVVILVFAVFPGGYTLQNELQKVGTTYDLMMVSTKDGPYSYVGDKWTNAEFFYDVYHPTSLGHGVMADCIFGTIQASMEQDKAASDINLDVKPAYNTNYLGLKTIFKDDYDESINLNMGSFTSDDGGSYQNTPVGKVYAKNFQHVSGSESLTFTVNCKNLLLAYRSVNNNDYGSIEVYVDGVKKKTIKGNTGSWGQSVTELIFAETVSKEHFVEIKMCQGDENKKFTITCMGYTE